MLLRLSDKMMIADRMPGGAPGPAWGVSGWGIPRWGGQAPLYGPRKPMPVGARYFCGDDYPQSKHQDEPCAMGNNYDSTREAYQDAVKAHYADDHPDLHYPVDQAKSDAKKVEAKRKARLKTLEFQEAMMKLMKAGIAPVKGGTMDVSGRIQAVKRPRELPDLTEYDFPDADLADAATEEIELDQLISITQRMGRRLLGAEFQGIAGEFATELITLAADNVISMTMALNTRTGSGINLDDPENLYRMDARVAMNVTEGSSWDGIDENTPPPGGVVYVAPRLFHRFTNNLDRQVDTGDLFVRWATVDQRLSTFLLFELLEQYSGLFGLT